MKKIILIITLSALIVIFLPRNNELTPPINYDDMVAENQKLASNYLNDREKITKNESKVHQNMVSDKEKLINNEKSIQKK